ncbi:MAG: pitrilysin family protein [Bacteroidota bacterium]
MSHIHFESFFLENGLKVVVHEDHSVPKAVFDIIYRVGAKDEDPSRTGFAHLFEHLMFRGSKHIPNYDRPLQRVGGANNAFTSADVTNYYISLPANQLETAFWLESDRMLELDLTEEKLEAEKSVVIEEYKQRYLNQPYGNAHLKLRELHFETHPYHWSPIGKDISHIAEASMEDVKDFFYGYYAPNNATLVVAGDVKVDEVRQLAEKWFGGIPRRSLKKHPIPQESPQTAARSMSLHGPVPMEAVYRMYHVPAFQERDFFIADMITDLLSGGKSGMLFQDLVKEQQISPSVGAYIWPMHDPGMISLDGKVAPGKTISAYESAVDESLAKLQDVQPEDLQRVKGKQEAGYVMQRTTLLNKATSLAISDAIGDINLVNQTMDIYRSIELDEVKTVAETYLRPENCSTLYYLPEKA